MKKKKILIIDDEKDFTRLTKLNLEGTGEFEVKTENSGLSGIDTARIFKPDIILLDVMMPNMDGGDVAFKLKNQKEIKDIPILFITAALTENDTSPENGYIAGHRFIAKPASLEKLVDFINKTLEES